MTLTPEVIARKQAFPDGWDTGIKECDLESEIESRKKLEHRLLAEHSFVQELIRKPIQTLEKWITVYLHGHHIEFSMLKSKCNLRLCFYKKGRMLNIEIDPVMVRILEDNVQIKKMAKEIAKDVLKKLER
jgi:hypothetical protein